MDCRKVKYRSEVAANYDLEHIRKISKRKIIPCRAYLCECGSWHLTSRHSEKDYKVLQLQLLALKNINIELQNENIKLDKENSVFKSKKYAVLAQAQTAEQAQRQHKIDVDIRVKKMQQTLVAKNKQIKTYRNQNISQITKILELERKINEKEISKNRND